MKHTINGMMVALALVLALVMGMAALAENAAPEVPELPAAGELQPDGAPAAPEAPTANDAQSNDSALQDALNAYREAKSSTRQEALEAELKSYVEAGKLTQAQADLILDYYKEQQSLRNGTCPGCGYQFQNGTGKNGRMNGNGRGMGGFGGMNGNGRGMGGFGGMGGRGMMGQGGANGMSFQSDAQPSVAESADEGI